jgi:hypothetical protein
MLHGFSLSSCSSKVPSRPPRNFTTPPTVDYIQFNEHFEYDGPTVFDHACRIGLEGIVSERLDTLSQRTVKICSSQRPQMASSPFTPRPANRGGP